MKCMISRSDIATLMSKVQNIVPAKPQSPILFNVLLEAVNDELVITATDLLLSIKVYIQAHVFEEGAIALPAKKLFPLLRELTTPEITIQTTSSHAALIEAGTSKFKILGFNAEEFPKVSEPTGGQQIPFSSSLLKEMLSKTAFAAGKDENRPIYSSVLLQRTGSLTTFTGADGRRLAKTYLELPLPMEWQGSFILPHKMVEEMIRLLDSKEEESVTLTFFEEKISLQTHSVTLISQLIAGQYPDVSRIIPENSPTCVKLHREELVTLLRQMALFTSSEVSSVHFHFTQGELTLSAQNQEMGEGRVNMPVNYQGEPIEIAFNPGYFLDILRHTKGETINLEIKDSYNPGLITEDESRSSLFVLMPMRLDG